MINMSLAPSVRARTSSSRFQSSRVNTEKQVNLKDDNRVAIAELGPSHVKCLPRLPSVGDRRQLK